jgi:sulfur carrier protein
VQVVVNGERLETLDAATLAGLLADLAVRVEYVAVEVNTELVPRSDFATHVLAPDDRIEIVTLVGGG